MPEISGRHGRSFDSNLDILFDEITLAAQWGRPSLLLAVHKSKYGQEKAEKALETRLDQAGFQVARVVVNDRRSDIAQLLRASPLQPRTVFFISNIDWGGGEDGRAAYRALNLHREFFVEQGIRAVFWLTTNEAENVPRFAPDFWAFRHRVVEFVRQRAAGHVRLPAGILAWDIGRSPDPFEDAESGIAVREELLRKLPNTLEALSTRVELHASLGHLRWTLGHREEASQEFQRGLNLASEHELAELKASLLNSLGILAYEGGDYTAAAERFTQGLQYRSSSRVLLLNLSAANCMLGRIHEALKLGKRAVSGHPLDADTRRRLGYIQNAAGKTDEAISDFAKATELAPRAADHRLALAVMYSLIDRPDDARIQITRAKELSGEDRAPYIDVVGEAALGDTTQALEQLRTAVEAGCIRKHEARRDVNLGLLFEQEQLEAVLA